MWSIHTILSSALSTSVRGAWNFTKGPGSWSLMLAAWSLMLAAWGLKLAAYSFKSLELEACCLVLAACCLGPGPGERSPVDVSNSLNLIAWSDIPRGNSLVLSICNGCNFSVPTCSAIFALVFLLRCWTCFFSFIRYNSRSPGPEGYRSLIYHVWTHTYDQVPRYLLELQTLQELCLSGRYPVFSIRRCSAYPKYIL